jgi:TRAP-type C4-dicarboxylate transport system permease small subunit
VSIGSGAGGALPPEENACSPEGPALRALGRLVAALSWVGMALAAASLLVSLVLIGWAVVMRYVFNDAPVWVDEVVGFALVAVVMLAAAQVLRRGEHIGVDLLVGRLPAKGRRWARAWAALATMAIACVLIVNGWETATLARTLGLVTEGSLEWPTWNLMLLMPIGGALLLLAAIEAFWRAVAGAAPTGTGTHAHEEQR